MGAFVDLTGKEFGDLTVLYREFDPEYSRAQWKTKCSCGNERIVSGTQLIRGKTTSCGHDYTNKTPDLIGKKINHLLVLKKIQESGKPLKWLCECDCPAKTQKLYRTKNLISGNRAEVESCGCALREKLKKPRAAQIGQIFGKLTTIAFRNRKWLCRCSCGQYRSAFTGDLTQDTNQSCNYCKQPKIYFRKNTLEWSGARTIWRNYKTKDPLMSITFGDFVPLIVKNCFYCAAAPKNDRLKKDYNFIYTGLDRIDPFLPHSLDNCVPCCRDCNRSKSNRLIEDFYQWVQTLKLNQFVPLKNLSLLEVPDNITRIKSRYNGYYSDGDLTLQQFYSLTQLPCFYCGAIGFNKKTTPYNGLDRVNNNLPHNLNNVVPCCHPCNWAKSNLTLEEFYTWVQNIKNNFVLGNILL